MLQRSFLVLALLVAAAPAKAELFDKFLRLYERDRIVTREVRPKDVYEGVPRFYDADTPILGGTRLRLDGLDAPELEQTCHTDNRVWRCGQAARQAIVEKVAGRRIVCHTVDVDDFSRPVVRCQVGDEDLGAWLAAQGWAVVRLKYDRTYLPQQERAHGACRNLWAEACGKVLPKESKAFENVAGFQLPWIWRDTARQR